MLGYSDENELFDAIQEHREFLIKKYKKYIDVSILNKYLPPEKSIVVNDDRDLYPQELILPEMPEPHKIDGFGLPYFQQYYRKPILPEKLQELIISSKSVKEVWQKIHSNRRYYKQEIIWIQKQWYYRLNGYWFYNNGVPTYIDGWNYYYLGYWHLDVGEPTYRYRDRIFYLYARDCFTTTTAPFFYRVLNKNIAKDYYHYFGTEKEAERYISTNNLLQRYEKGFWVIDYGRRTCYGFNYPKHRREGATSKAGAINAEMISRTKNAKGVVMSKDGDSAQETFSEKVVVPFRQLPFFFMPQILGSINTNADVLTFDSQFIRGTKDGVSLTNVNGLTSAIEASTSSDERKKDGFKYFLVHGDEVGKENKARPYNLTLRHDIMKKTVAQFPLIHGLMINTSTSDDTKGDAGRRYMELCNNSKWHERDYVTGLTRSGLFNLFIPAYINLDGYTDMYGNPIVGKPTPEQQKICKSPVGAKELIESNLQQNIDDPETYYNVMREFPIEYRQCFMSSGEDSGFDLLSIVNRISDLDMNDDLKPRVGDFEWENGWGSTVRFVDKLDGKFELSYFPDTPNASIMQRGMLRPRNTDKFVAACDPFRYDETRRNRRSKGAGAVFLKRDKIIDPDDKPVEEWETYRFCCTYNNAVTEAEYREDMLMMTIFYGCEMFPEMNEEMVYKYFRDSKYKHYLGYLYIDGQKAKLPGFYTQHNIKQRMFKLWKIKIEQYCANERHRSLLKELADIEGFRDMINYDLFAASGGCLLALYYAKPTLNVEEDEVKDTNLLEYVLRMQRN